MVAMYPLSRRTMSGRRTRNAVRDAVTKNGLPSDTMVVIAGLSNTYSDYVVTYEEYQVQRREGREGGGREGGGGGRGEGGKEGRGREKGGKGGGRGRRKGEGEGGKGEGGRREGRGREGEGRREGEGGKRGREGGSYRPSSVSNYPQVQRYEGGSTAYGPHTLSAYIQEFSKLAVALAKVTKNEIANTCNDRKSHIVNYMYFHFRMKPIPLAPPSPITSAGSGVCTCQSCLTGLPLGSLEVL